MLLRWHIKDRDTGMPEPDLLFPIPWRVPDTGDNARGIIADLDKGTAFESSKNLYTDFIQIPSTVS